MSLCYCRAVLSALVIVFAWYNLPWLGSTWALTIIGAVLVLWAVFANDKCCCRSCGTEAKPVAKPVVAKTPETK